MALRQKRANNRGTFLLVDGQKFDISNIVHESTERIPEEVTVVMRRPLWTGLYPCLSTIEQLTNVQDDDNLVSSGSSYAEGDLQFSASINSTPATREEKAEVLKNKRTGGIEHVDPQTVHGAVYLEERRTAFTHLKPGDVHTGEYIDIKKAPGAVHVMDGPGKYRSESDSGSSISGKHPNVARELPDQHKIPRERHSSFSIESSFSNEWDNENQRREDDDASSSSSQRVSASHYNQVEMPHYGEKPLTVQVTDDLELPLHGAKETSRALDAGKMVTVVCLICQATLRCIDIAQYVLCPECRCVTPLETRNSSGGIGLGLLSTFDRHPVGIA